MRVHRPAGLGIAHMALIEMTEMIRLIRKGPSDLSHISQRNYLEKKSLEVKLTLLIWRLWVMEAAFTKTTVISLYATSSEFNYDNDDS